MSNSKLADLVRRTLQRPQLPPKPGTVELRRLPTAPISVSLGDLKQAWPSLMNDVERGLAISWVHQSGQGPSKRAIAKALNRSDGTIRNLIQAALAPPAHDLEDKPSTRKLVQRTKSAALEEKAVVEKALEKVRMQQSTRASDAICEWLAKEGIAGRHAEQVIDEARREIATAIRNGTRLTIKTTTGDSLEEIRVACQPGSIRNDEIHVIAWYAEWLAGWMVAAFTDSRIRDTALNLALRKLMAQ